MRKTHSPKPVIITDPNRIRLGDEIRVTWKDPAHPDLTKTVQGVVYNRDYSNGYTELTTQYGGELLHYGPGYGLPVSIVVVTPAPDLSQVALWNDAKHAQGTLALSKLSQSEAYEEML